MTEWGHKEDLNKDIITVSGNLFRKFGFKKTTVEDIAREIGKRKSSLYYYYKSKEEIFEAVVNEEMHRFFRLIKRSLEHSKTSKQKLMLFCKAQFQHLASLCNLNGALKDEIHDIPCVITPIKNRFDTTQIELIKEILQEGVDKREFKNMSTGEMNAFAYLIVSSFRGLELPLVTNGPDLDSRIAFIVEMMVEGIGRQDQTVPLAPTN
ncbi:transcriptional regulator, TetR family [Filimonas lacunae]|uniref:Transcriptional regulator, TetR family n=2 Tax=Filimonas lacunae TaxID=477680 RepID=A0A173MM57_9BACT|nr:transcriptional regulator, TetR family [Filimonas lacunae]SIS60442.1 transcriptional regulator, TetR family [Filimonas lacunae]